MSLLEFKRKQRTWRADVSRPLDISIPLRFDGAQPHCFGAPPARAETYVAGTFEGDVRRGGSCNCSTHVLTPHCNGTHTECVGHITHERVSIRDVAQESLLLAGVVSIEPQPSPKALDASDRVIRGDALRAACKSLPAECQALVLRSLPNSAEKLARDYDAGPCPAYLEAEAAHYLVECGIEHLLVDLPSIDRMADEGRLLAHRIFWGLPLGANSVTQATRPHATITELIYVDSQIADGVYLLNLQIAPFVADAAPSRPVLYPVTPL